MLNWRHEWFYLNAHNLTWHSAAPPISLLSSSEALMKHKHLDCYNYDCFACSLEINISNTFYIFQLTLTVIFYWPIQGKKAKLWYKSLLLLRWTETESDYCPCKPWTSLLTLRCRHWTVIASHSLLFFLLLFFPAPLFYSTEGNRREWFCNRLINVNLVSLAVITLKL